MTQAFNLSQFANKVNTSGQADLTTAVTGTLPQGNGGTGTTTASNGQLLIGNGSGFTKATITAGTGISVTNDSGSITVASTATSGFANMQVFTNPGTFTTPASTTQIKVTVVGGGAAGNPGTISSSSGGTSSFGALASATGGSGTGSSSGGSGGAGSAGTILLNGGPGGPAGSPAIGGSSILGPIRIGNILAGINYGGGGSGTGQSTGPLAPSNRGGGGGGGAAIYVGPVTASTPYPVTVGPGGPSPGGLTGGAGIVIVEY